MIICSVLFFFFGLMIGAFSTLLFFRFDKQWKRVVLGLVDFSSSSGIGIWAVSYFKISRQNSALLFLVLYIGMIISVIIAFYFLTKLVNKDDSKIPIRKLDIILGYDKFLEQYYDNRIENVKSFEIERQKAQLEKKKEFLDDLELKIKDQMKNAISINLPKNTDVPITNHFMGMLPVYIDYVYAFRSNVNDLTNQIIEALTDNDKKKNAEILKGYFAGIGMYVANDLFGISGNKKEVRTHFRIYKNGKHIQYTVVEGSNMSSVKIHDIPGDKNSLIKKSFELKRSVIASLNSDEIYDVNTTWQDFMTITYYNIIINDNPFLSMGISIKNKEQFFDLLTFLNYYRIEDCLQVYIERVNKRCDIVGVLGDDEQNG